MKIFPNSNRGLTIIDVLVLLVLVAVGVFLFLPRLSNHPTSAKRINCVANLKGLGVEYRVFANDHDGNFPNQLAMKDGGTKEWISNGRLPMYFQFLANEFAPKILVCPADSRLAAQDFRVLSTTNISYFVCANAEKTNLSMFLAGDRDLTSKGIPLRSGNSEISSNSILGWTGKLHENGGNIGLSDGSVQQTTASKLNEIATFLTTNITVSIP